MCWEIFQTKGKQTYCNKYRGSSNILPGRKSKNCAIDVYFLLLFKCKRSEFSLLQTGTSLFLCFFLRHTIQNLEEILELKLDTLLAFFPCIRTMIKYTVSTRQSTCFIQTLRNGGLFSVLTQPYLNTKPAKKTHDKSPIPSPDQVMAEKSSIQNFLTLFTYSHPNKLINLIDGEKIV